MAHYTFLHDLDFLSKQTEVIVLKDDTTKGQVIICPALQSRIMTSTNDGPQGRSLGFINHEHIKSNKINPNINPFGGEDRFWLGPEAGQFALFFKNGQDFNVSNAVTPSGLDRESWNLKDISSSMASFKKNLFLENYAGFQFKIEVNREIRILNFSEILDLTGVEDKKVKMVGFQSVNEIENTGEILWEKKTGLISIWILGMFPATANSTIICPYKEIDEYDSEIIVNDGYFGKVPEDRIIITDKTIFFKGDGNFRSKIGIPPLRALPIIGCYDHDNSLLTVVKFSLPDKAKNGYVNSMWEIQSDPYGGDVSNSYNDADLNFFELESSSPALALAPGETYMHKHTTFHFTGQEDELNKITKKLFGIQLKEIPKF